MEEEYIDYQDEFYQEQHNEFFHAQEVQQELRGREYAE